MGTSTREKPCKVFGAATSPSSGVDQHICFQLLSLLLFLQLLLLLLFLQFLLLLQGEAEGEAEAEVGLLHLLQGGAEGEVLLLRLHLQQDEEGVEDGGEDLEML